MDVRGERLKKISAAKRSVLLVEAGRELFLFKIRPLCFHHCVNSPQSSINR